MKRRETDTAWSRSPSKNGNIIFSRLMVSRMLVWTYLIKNQAISLDDLVSDFCYIRDRICVD